MANWMKNTLYIFCSWKQSFLALEKILTLEEIYLELSSFEDSWSDILLTLSVLSLLY